MRFLRRGLAGSAAVPYPTNRSSDGSATSAHLFRPAERSVLKEVLHAADGRRDAQLSVLGYPPPWLLSQGAARYTVWDEQYRLTAPTIIPSQADEAVSRVLHWLADHGAVRPLPDAQRRLLAETGREQRRAQGLMVEGFMKLADEDAFRNEKRALATDQERWIVAPDQMLRVYPGLARMHPRWAERQHDYH